MALALFAGRLYSFMKKSVKTPAPVSRADLLHVIAANRASAREAGFDCEVDFAVYIIAALCFHERAASGEWADFISSLESVEEKRYRLSAQLDAAGFMKFGSLERPDPGE